MRSWSVPDREHLIPPAVFVVLAGLIVIAMFAVFPGKEAFMKSVVNDEPDEVSAAYLRLFLDSPEMDSELLFAFASQLRSQNRLEEVKDILEELSRQSGPQRLESRYRLFQIRWRQYNDQSLSRYYREYLLEQVLVDLGWLAEGLLVLERYEAVADVALQIGRPEIAARAYIRLAALDPAGGPNWLETAGRWLLACGRPGEAARLFARGSDLSASPRHARQRAVRALRAFVAAGPSAEGLSYSRRAVRSFPGAVNVAEWSFRLARWYGDDSLARESGRLLAESRWNDEEFLELLLSLELAASQDERGLALAQRLVELRPDDPKRRERLAQLAEWTGRPELALAERIWLARRYSDDPNLDRALNLSSSLYQYQIFSELLELRSLQRKLEEIEVRVLVGAYEHECEPEKAVHYLDERSRKYPNERFALDQLVALFERMGRPSDALAVLEEIEWRHGLNLRDVTLRARYYWRLDQLELAFAHLSTYRLLACPEDLEYWKLLADSAWSLEEDEMALEAHRELWHREQQTAGIADRLIVLERQRGFHEASLLVAVEAWERFHESRYLVQAMESASRGGLWKEARALVRLAGDNEPQFLQYEFYLLLRARLYDREGDVERGRAFYDLTLTLHPRSRYARSGLLWMLINHERKGELGRYLRAWESVAREDSALWQPFAAGFQLLGRVEESLPWYRRQAEKSPDDFLWLLRYAEALDQAGQPNTAFRIRRYIVQDVLPRQRDQLAENVPSRIDPRTLRRYAVLTRDVFGVPSDDDWIDAFVERFGRGGGGDPNATLWFLRRGGLDRPLGNYWEKASANSRRLAWRLLTLALNDENLGTVASFVKESQEEPGAKPRSSKIDEEGEAAANVNSPWVFTDRVTVRTELERVGDLESLGVETEYESRAGRYRFAFRSGFRFFHASDLSLGDRRWEADYSSFGEVRRPSWTARLTLGANLQEPDAIARAIGTLDWRWTETLDSRLLLAWNEESLESTAVRVAGARHRVAASVSQRITNHLGFDVEVGGQRVHSRSGSEIATGYTVDATVWRWLARGDSNWQAYVSGGWGENSLRSELPPSIEGLFPQPVPVSSVVPQDLGLISLGTTLWNRDSEGPLSGWPSVRYSLDAWIGWLTSADELAYEIKGELGVPLTGDDELGVFLLYSDSAGGLEGQVNAGLSIFYRWSF